MSGKQDTIPPWGLAVAGATGAVIANALVYPLDMCVKCPQLSGQAKEPTSHSFRHALTTRTSLT